MLKYIQNAIDNIQESKLNQKAITMGGMSSFKVRNFLNRLLEMPNSRYLEVGVLTGSTFYSALYGNTPDLAIAIDNFSEFYGREEIFLNNLKDVGTNFTFINMDAFTTKEELVSKKFNIYFYDGNHTEESQYKAIEYYLDNLDDEFIYICDDWNHIPAQQGTFKAIKEQNLTLVKEWILPASYNGDINNWWNGLWVAILRK